MNAGLIQRVSSLEQNELEPYRTLKRPMAHARLGIFVAEGEKVVCRLLDSGLEVKSLLLTPNWLARLQSAGHLEGREDVTVFLAEEGLLREIVGFNIHQGIMAVAKAPAEGSPDDLPASHLLVALDGLRTSENVGVIVRNCAAFGVNAILVGETSCSPYLRRAVRNSMGAVFKIPVIHVTSLAESLGRLRCRFQTRIVVADPRGASTIHGVVLTGNVCIVLGNEDTGVSAEVAGLATERAAIPMHNQTDSLNVASAGGVFLYEAHRQRAAAGGQA
ncbi:MAG: RNA methyltransferase [Acidobacteriia bacterium]|nr:RNA methyltransferase [Terriglobia bacterium]